MLNISRDASAQLSPWWAQDSTDSSEIKRSALADSIIDLAKSYLGTPYVWGGENPESGFDCSGFVCYVFKSFGIDIPRTSDRQFDAGTPVPYVEAAPGDLILFEGPADKPGDPGHVGIILSYNTTDGFTFIHTSSAETGGVRISNERTEAYYTQRFLEVRRVIDAY